MMNDKNVFQGKNRDVVGKEGEEPAFAAPGT